MFVYSVFVKLNNKIPIFTQICDMEKKLFELMKLCHKLIDQIDSYQINYRLM